MQPGITAFPAAVWYGAIPRTKQHMRRRDFITLLGGAAVWPLAARAQQPEQMRRVGVLIAASEDDPDMRSRLAGFRQGLERLGSADGRNPRVHSLFPPGPPPPL